MNDTEPAGAGGDARRSPWLVRAFSAVVAVMMFAMMALTFTDVVARYVFNAPIGAAFEIIEFLMGLLIFSALPLITLDRAHITVSLLDGLFRRSRRIRWAQQLFVLVFSTGAVGFITSRLWAQAETMREIQEPGEYLDIEIAPLVYVLAGLSLIAFVILLGMVVRYLSQGLSAPDQAPPQSGF